MADVTAHDVRALDALDREAHASVFTEDGQFGTGGNATKGRAALARMQDGSAPGNRPCPGLGAAWTTPIGAAKRAAVHG